MTLDLEIRLWPQPWRPRSRGIDVLTIQRRSFEYSSVSIAALTIQRENHSLRVLVACLLGLSKHAHRVLLHFFPNRGVLIDRMGLTVNSVRVRLVWECFDLRRARRHDKAVTLVLSRSDVRGEKVMVRIHWRRRIYWRHLL